jgi:hypothetical protein
MNARLSHAAQQQVIDEALSSLPSQRWRWLFTPDPKWLASVNTGTLREVNAVRMFVVTTLLMVVLELGVMVYAFGRCHYQGPLGPGETAAVVRRLCEESLATARMLDFVSSLFGSYCLLLGGMAGIAVGAMIGKRATDTEHRERVEQAKKAPVLIAPVTQEHPVQPVTITAQDQSTVKVDASPVAEPEKPPTPVVSRRRGDPVSSHGPKEPNVYLDDERGEEP